MNKQEIIVKFLTDKQVKEGILSYQYDSKKHEEQRLKCIKQFKNK